MLYYIELEVFTYPHSDQTAVQQLKVRILAKYVIAINVFNGVDVKESGRTVVSEQVTHEEDILQDLHSFKPDHFMENCREKQNQHIQNCNHIPNVVNDLLLSAYCGYQHWKVAAHHREVDDGILQAYLFAIVT